MADLAAIRARLAEVKSTEAATADAKAATRVARVAKAKEPNHCMCGCGGETMSRFVPGHDAKLRSRLLNEAHGDDQDKALEALQALDELGWAHFFVPRTKPTRSRTVAA